MLRFLSEMLEKSLFVANFEKEKSSQIKEDEKEQRTWAAGFGQKQKRCNLIESMIQQNVGGIDNMGIIHEEQEQQMGKYEKCEKEIKMENDKGP